MKTYLILLSVICLLLPANTMGQAARPFPQNIDYAFGYKSKNLTSANALDSYEKWKDSVLVKCNEGYRVTCEGWSETRVEAIGFAMILTAYYADKEEFDGLYEFYKRKRTTEARNMMAWNVTCDGINDPGSATDGDIDVAFALIVAHAQWGGEYLNNAINIISIIKRNVLIKCDSLLALAPGYSTESETGGMWGGCSLTDIQYYTPAFFRLFAEASNDNDWNKLADDTYTILKNAAHPVTGLVPDWQSVAGNPGGNSQRVPYFRYDACRVPWRITIDYLWNGNSHAKDWCTKVSSWAYTVGPANIKDGYNLDGTPQNDGNHNSAFTGGFAVASMCNSIPVSDEFAKEMMSNKLGDGHWFMLSTRAIYMLPLTGNFWKPEIDRK